MYTFLTGSYVGYSPSAVSEEPVSLPRSFPAACRWVRSGREHIHTGGLSPELFCNTAVPCEGGSKDKCKHTCSRHSINLAFCFSWFISGLYECFYVPCEQGRNLRGGVCKLWVFWEQARKRQLAEQRAYSNPQSAFLHLIKIKDPLLLQNFRFKIQNFSTQKFPNISVDFEP